MSAPPLIRKIVSPKEKGGEQLSSSADIDYSMKQSTLKYATNLSARKVYHASGMQGLTKILPRISTHDEPWVYATKDIALAALFLNSRGGDLSCSVGYLNGQLHICERWQGAFDDRYKGRNGSIYVLPGDTFCEGKTSFDAEVVSDVAVSVIREIQVIDAKTYILELERTGQLRIYMFADRPACYPEDDQDLVDKAVRFAKRHREAVLRYVELHHPHLLQRVQNAL